MPITQETPEVTRAALISHEPDTKRFIDQIAQLRKELADPNLAEAARTTLSLLLSKAEVAKRLSEITADEAGGRGSYLSNPFRGDYPLWDKAGKKKPLMTELGMIAIQLREDEGIRGSILTILKDLRGKLPEDVVTELKFLAKKEESPTAPKIAKTIPEGEDIQAQLEKERPGYFGAKNTQEQPKVVATTAPKSVLENPENLETFEANLRKLPRGPAFASR